MCATSTNDPFIIGLRAIIKSGWSTQKEFADGITSRVNLTNILRGAVGTSQKMRQALADKAGLTIDQIIELGNKTLNPVVNSCEKSEIKLSEIHAMNGSEIHSKVNNCSQNLHAGLREYTIAMFNAVSGLIKEREELISLFYQERSTLNTITEIVKVVGPDLKILACNRACTEKYMQVIGDSCVVDGRDVCKTDCIAQRAFNSGQPVWKLSIQGNIVDACVAYPMLNQENTVEKVVIVIRNLNDFIPAFREAGIRFVKKKK